MDPKSIDCTKNLAIVYSQNRLPQLALEETLKVIRTKMASLRSISYRVEAWDCDIPRTALLVLGAHLAEVLGLNPTQGRLRELYSDAKYLLLLVSPALYMLYLTSSPT